MQVEFTRLNLALLGDIPAVLTYYAPEWRVPPLSWIMPGLGILAVAAFLAGYVRDALFLRRFRRRLRPRPGDETPSARDEA